MDNIEVREQQQKSGSGFGWLWWCVIGLALIVTIWFWYRQSGINAQMKKVRDAKKKEPLTGVENV
jgi:hypothetical protein